MPITTRPARFRCALEIVDGSDLADVLTHDLTTPTGRPRLLPFRALLALLVIGALSRQRVVMTDTERVLRGLNPEQREALVLPHGRTFNYSHIESGVADLYAGLLPVADRQTGEVAIDATDVETWAARRSRASLLEKPNGEIVESVREPIVSSGFPRLGLDGRLQHSADPDARDGYRSGKNLNHKDIFLGYHLHLAVDISPMGGGARTPLVRAIDVVPAGSSNTAAGLRLIDALCAQDPAVHHVIADRGYTYGITKSWALPLIGRGITQTLDLHANQQATRPGPIAGTVYIDGTLFTAIMPKALRNLKRPILAASASQRAQSAENYDRRLRYAFTPFGTAHPDGRQRFRGPALTGRVRCPNVPTSMRAPHARPLTTCIPGEPCACGTTITLRGDQARERQRHPYGTTRWLADYSRRSAVESYNASLKYHHGSLRRGSIRVFGQTKNTLFVAILVAATNARIIVATRREPRTDEPAPDNEVLLTPGRKGPIALHRRLASTRGSPPEDQSPSFSNT